jgi:putative ABC transport system ATP-binding protein
MSLIVADDVRKAYRIGDVTVAALKGLSFVIEPASFVSFVGPSGGRTPAERSAASTNPRGGG